MVLVGGGFGGLYAARELADAGARVTLIDRRNFHLFQPLLYQVATGALSPANIAAPLRGILRSQRNAAVLLAEAVDLDVAGRRLILADGVVPYDTLIVATGVTHHYFGNDAWEPLAPGLKSIEDATEMRRRILQAFERAERESDPAARRAWLTFAVVGGGPTGVELAGALGEISRHTLREDFRSIDPADAHVLLVEGQERILPSYTPDLSAKAARSLAALGVDVRTSTRLREVTPEGVTLQRDGHDEAVPARTVLWAAGVKASRLGSVLSEKAGAPLDRAGRVRVAPDLTVPGHPEIFVLGDLASLDGPDGKPLPGVAPVAMQQGRFVADVVKARLAGRRPADAFVYRDKGSMATIGRAAAVADLGFVRFGGFLAWMAWLFIHIMYLVQFSNRVLVLIQWAWSYVSWSRSARLITGEKASGSS